MSQRRSHTVSIAASESPPIARSSQPGEHWSWFPIARSSEPTEHWSWFPIARSSEPGEHRSWFPIARSSKPDEHWSRCYLDEVGLLLTTEGGS